MTDNKNENRAKVIEYKTEIKPNMIKSKLEEKFTRT